MTSDKDEMITITADDFVTVAAELTAHIHMDALRRAKTDSDVAMVCLVDEMLLHFSADLKHKLFERFKLEIEEEDK